MMSIAQLIHLLALAPIVQAIMIDNNLMLRQSAATTSLRKRGLSYQNPPAYIRNFNAPRSQVSWAYDWASKKDPNFPVYLEYVPMLWNAASSRTTVWSTNVNDAITKGTKNVLGFNEPDSCGSGQACMSPRQAADAWMKWMQPFAGRVRLGGPVTTEGYSGTLWLQQFLGLCARCTIDFIPVHIYSTVNNLDHFQNHIQDIRNITAKPIWVTEFHASGTETEQIAFLKTIMLWMDQQHYIERYAWFMCSPTFTGGSLVGSNAKPTKLGSVYELN